ncbi:MAG: hypothetical protein IPK72_21235 [Candidatus Eisenbacteria bacterium]|nr:hypothetical protein [Candidatus Eisenbacteria bacterium]
MKTDRQQPARLEISERAFSETFQLVHSALDTALKKHGRGSFVSTHEAVGALAEEYAETLAAARLTTLDVCEELLDCAIVCIVALASYNEALLRESGHIEGSWGALPKTPGDLALEKLLLMATPGNGYPKGIREDVGATLAIIEGLRRGGGEE